MIVAQWNMGIYTIGADLAIEKRRTALLAKLLTRYKPDLVALQEAPIPLVEQLLQNHNYSTASSSLDRRMVTAWKNTSWGAELAQPINYPRALAVLLPLITSSGIACRVLVCNIHLPALAPHGSQPKTVASLKDFKRELERYRTSAGNDDVAEIILGDFNLEPHTLAMHDKQVLAGNRSLQYVMERELSRPKGEWYRPLYNPSWRLYGAENSPHGTLYCTGDVDEPWYVYDQALFSGDLVCKAAKVKLITKIGRQSLLTTGVLMPDKKIGSDHLPVVWTVVTSQ